MACAGPPTRHGPGVHRRRVGDHRRLRRPDPPADLPVHPRPRRRRRRHRRRPWPPRSACTPTSPATTSTSSPPAATSRSSRRGVATAGRRAGRPSKRYVAVANAFDAGVPVRSDDLVLALLGRALDRLPRARGRGDGRGGRRRRTAGRWPPGSPATRSPPGSARCARRCRPSPTRSPRTASPPTWPPAPHERPADHQRPLPVRHRRHRPPGDLRRRPRHGARHAQRARTATATTSRSPPRPARPAATRSAPPPSDHPSVRPSECLARGRPARDTRVAANTRMGSDCGRRRTR